MVFGIWAGALRHRFCPSIPAPPPPSADYSRHFADALCARSGTSVWFAARRRKWSLRMVDPMPTFRAATRLCVKIRLLVYIAKGGPLKLAKVNWSAIMFPICFPKAAFGKRQGREVCQVFEPSIQNLIVRHSTSIPRQRLLGGLLDLPKHLDGRNRDGSARQAVRQDAGQQHAF